MFKNYLFHQMSELPGWQQILRQRVALKNTNYKFWLNYNLFSFVWWLMLIFFILVWVIWWKLVDKTRLAEIVLYGLMIGLAATLMDVVGVAFILWGYPNMFSPLVPPVFSITVYGLLPIAFMLTYQYTTDWKSFAIATVIVSIILAFVAEPVAEGLGILQLNKWKHLYSFFTNIAIPLSLKYVINKILAIQKKQISQAQSFNKPKITRYHLAPNPAGKPDKVRNKGVKPKKV